MHAIELFMVFICFKCLIHENKVLNGYRNGLWNEKEV